jgi:hypothetical protein
MISPSGGVGVRNGTVNPRATSSNWAGYAVTGRSHAFRSVSASWIQPRANCKTGKGRRLASFWVGLDGANSNSVEQLGTDSDCHGKTASYFAWWEMFPAASVNLPNRVHPGDHLSASVTFRGTRTYVLFIRDATRHWHRTIIKNQAGLARSSAEVIAESPAMLIGGQIVIQNLADFGNVRFTGSRVNGTPLKEIGRRVNITMTEVHSPRVRATTSPVGSADVFTCHFVRSA